MTQEELTELKAKAYELVCVINNANRELQQIEAQIYAQSKEQQGKK
ncbi:MAG: hypothetical protein H6Q17_573 [Bacteroidetes bacterium]|nr:hypothetical protein [Bacteroidota bacterium]